MARFIIQHCVNGDGLKNGQNGFHTHSPIHPIPGTKKTDWKMDWKAGLKCYV